jgi:hypothetical protein
VGNAAETTRNAAPASRHGAGMTRCAVAINAAPRDIRAATTNASQPMEQGLAAVAAPVLRPIVVAVGAAYGTTGNVATMEILDAPPERTAVVEGAVRTGNNAQMGNA